MKKYLIFSLFVSWAVFCFAEMIPITFVSEKGNEIKLYDEETTEFSIDYGSVVIGVENLESLAKLKTFESNGAANLSDYSFLEKCKPLENIAIYDGKIDSFDFLYSLPNLKTATFCNVKFPELPDFSKFKKLEFVSLSENNLSEKELVPLFRHSKSLKFVNLWNNNITDTSFIAKKDKAIYFLAFNPVAEILAEEKTNLIFDTSYKKLPGKYMRFVR